METTANDSNNKRRKLLTIAIGFFAVIGGAYAAYWATVARYVESTDNAYVGGNIVQIMPQVPGTVVAINADDTDFVNAGQVLVELDKADTRVALEQAEAQLAKTVRQVRNAMATTGQLDATLAQREAEVGRATDDLQRREKLLESGAVSGEEIQHARDAVKAAQAARDAAQQQLSAQRALTERTTLDNHPDVQAAAAKVREAYLAYSRTALPAPVAGYVAKRSVQVGQRVNPGTPLMTVVPLEQVWVDANFKESQIARLRVGQPVKLRADAYGRAVEYHGKLAGFGAGTGAAFALLPAQNASGNWIKVVQRVPVRIELDAAELAQHPLQVGLSMQVHVDTHHRDGAQLPKTAHESRPYQTSAFDGLDRLAEARVHAILTGQAAPLLPKQEAPAVRKVAHAAKTSS
jgi:membrane fusion protein (multidrug efflux system)